MKKVLLIAGLVFGLGFGVVYHNANAKTEKKDENQNVITEDDVLYEVKFDYEKYPEERERVKKILIEEGRKICKKQTDYEKCLQPYLESGVRIDKYDLNNDGVDEILVQQNIMYCSAVGCFRSYNYVYDEKYNLLSDIINKKDNYRVNCDSRAFCGFFLFIDKTKNQNDYQNIILKFIDKIKKENNVDFHFLFNKKEKKYKLKNI